MKRLSDVAVIEVGFAFPSKAFGEVGNGPRLVRGDNIGHGSLRWGEATTWAWPGEAPDAKYELAEHDLVIGMDRPWISAGVKFATVTRSDLPALLVQRVARIRARAGVSQRFLRYVISHPSYAEYIQSVQTGTSIPHVSATQIGAYPLPHSEDVNAIRIAEVLGALDDKIAANATVCDAAVGLANQVFVAAKAGADLSRRVFDDVTTAAGGGTPSTKVPEYWDGDVLWVTPTDVTALSAPYLDRTARMITEAGLSKCSSALYPVDSILMTSRATIGAFALVKMPVAVNQGFIVAHARDPHAQLWLFHEMRSRVDDFLLHANGATFLELSKSKFRAIQVDWPVSRVTCQEFDSTVSPLHEKAYAATVESRHLAALRDTLLPHLMSGRITVRDAEKAVENA